MSAKLSSNLEKLLEILPKSRVKDKDIVHEAEKSFLDYSLSVITSRALPDLKDGLKPVHRRILYSAYEEKMFNDSRFKKSAALVGAVMGAYHPHGDSSIYGALVRLSQDFSMRYPLLEGQGNFGSIDGDSPAAMRYTEVKMSKMGEMFLEGIKENCVDFSPNYDGSREEPSVLPVVVPSLLLNGGEGIAVGMASRIPPHNLHEVCDAAIALIDNPEMKPSEFTSFIKGPDFPTGGEVIKNAKRGSKEEIYDYLNDGRGSFVIRAKAQIEQDDNSSKNTRIIITEIPFGVKKSALIKKIAERSSEVKGTKGKKPSKAIGILQRFVKDIRDESNLKEGIRLIIECQPKSTRDDLQVVLNNLYKYTPLQKHYAANLTFLNNGKPEVWGVGPILRRYLEHQLEMLVRKTSFNLEKIEARIHLLEGRSTVVNDLVRVIKIITEEEEPEKIIKEEYSLSDIQIKDIFDLPLRQLKRIELRKLVEELEEKYKSQAEHKELLGSKILQNERIKNRLQEIKDSFKDDKRITEINGLKAASLTVEDLILDEMLVTNVSKNQYISAFPLSRVEKSEKKYQKGDSLGALPNQDKVKDLLVTSSRDDLLLFSSAGKVYRLKAHQLKVNQEKGWSKKPISLKNLIEIEGQKKERIVKTIAMKREEYQDDFALLFVTEKGMVKLTKSSEFNSILSTGKTAIRLFPGDSLKFVIKTKSDVDILIATAQGNVVRFRTGPDPKWKKELSLTESLKSQSAQSLSKQLTTVRQLMVLNKLEEHKLDLSEIQFFSYLRKLKVLDSIKKEHKKKQEELKRSWKALKKDLPEQLRKSKMKASDWKKSRKDVFDVEKRFKEFWKKSPSSLPNNADENTKIAFKLWKNKNSEEIELISNELELLREEKLVQGLRNSIKEHKEPLKELRFLKKEDYILEDVLNLLKSNSVEELKNSLEEFKSLREKSFEELKDMERTLSTMLKGIKDKISQEQGKLRKLRALHQLQSASDEEIRQLEPERQKFDEIQSQKKKKGEKFTTLSVELPRQLSKYKSTETRLLNKYVDYQRIMNSLGVEI